MRMSVIIPTIDEEASLPATLHAVKKHAKFSNLELIIADGGSSDNTLKIAENAGAKVLQCPQKGRGAQLHAGAKSATGEVLYFLHADSVPPEGFDEAVLSAVENGAPAGCFQMRFDHNAMVFRFYGWATRFPSIYCRGGDQSLFITKALYQDIGGFRTEFPIFEDIDIIERIRKGHRFAILPQKISTSARKYQINGFYRLQILFAALHFKYRLGAGPEELHRFYQKHIRS